MNSALANEIFISHAAGDRRFVDDELVGLLRALGFEPWYAEEAVTTADDWERVILRGLETSPWFLLVLSAGGARSPWVRSEVGWAVKNRFGNIIPLRVDDSDPSLLHLALGQLQFLDFRADARARSVEKLISLLVNAEYRLASLANVLVGVARCPSKEALTVVLLDVGGDRSVITAANEEANDLFARMAGKTIEGLSLREIFDQILPDWRDAEHYADFLADQDRLMKDRMTGGEIVARVPLIINGKHPVRGFPGKSFLPITIAYSKPFLHHSVLVEDYLIMYTDVVAI